MDRVPYRRVSPPRSGPARTDRHRETKTTFGETVIVQAIISGLLLAVVLVICLVDIGPLVTLRGRLGQVLDGATTVEEFNADIRRMRENWLDTPQPAPPAQIELPEIVPPFSYIPYIPLTANEEPINPQIPGPSMGPGLWD